MTELERLELVLHRARTRSSLTFIPMFDLIIDELVRANREWALRERDPLADLHEDPLEDLARSLGSPFDHISSTKPTGTDT